MIPFEADPILYYAGVLCLIASLLFFAFGYFSPKGMCSFFYPVSLLFVIIAMATIGVIYSGSTQQTDIVVCNHITDDSWMYIIGEDQQTYMISDPDLKLRIHDGDTISTMVLNKWGNGYKEIYKIDAPFVCEGAKGC